MSRWGESPPRPASVDALLDPAVAAALVGLDIESRKLLASPRHGERRSTRRGTSVEFADFRPYTAGDDLRRIDWNVYARLDALVIKLFQDEEDLLTVLAVDDSASMRFGTPCKHTTASKIAFALGVTALGAGHRVQAHALGAEGAVSQTLRGRGGAGQLGKWLIDLSADGRGDLAMDLKALSGAVRGRAKIIVLTDALVPSDAMPAAMSTLASRGHDVHLLQVLSPQELQPLATGLSGDHRLVDAETGEGPAVSMTASIEAEYRARLNAHVEMIDAAAHRCGVRPLLVRTDEPLEDLLRSRLRQGGVLR
ncbi:MAG: DUF58 domain-containing protein [Phycisphaerales bacterium]|nr:DUF58 domain-containing protein [Phycisphaerales bacterium]